MAEQPAYSLGPIESAVFILICVCLIVSGRIGVIVGMYLSLMFWSRSLRIFSIVHTWILIFAMSATTTIYVLKNGWGPRLPRKDRWIILWMGAWWFWQFLLIAVNDFQLKAALLRTAVFRTILPLPFVIVIAHDSREIRGFTLGYAGATLLNGLFVLDSLSVSFRHLLSDPVLNDLNVLRLGLNNYHWFSYTFAISSILVFAAMLHEKKRLISFLGAGSVGYFSYFLLMSTSKQSIGSFLLVILGLVLWLQFRRQIPRLTSLAVLLVVTWLFFYLYQRAPEMILRHSDSLIEAFDLIGDRGQLWLIGWDTFLHSPLWGSGFVNYTRIHNLFFGTLGDQGLVGFVFLIGFLVFVSRQIRPLLAVQTGRPEVLWRAGFACIVLFGLLHAQASGNALTVSHIYWGAAFLWILNEQADLENGRMGPSLTRYGQHPPYSPEANANPL